MRREGRKEIMACRRINEIERRKRGMYRIGRENRCEEKTAVAIVG